MRAGAPSKRSPAAALAAVGLLLAVILGGAAWWVHGTSSTAAPDAGTAVVVLPPVVDAGAPIVLAPEADAGGTEPPEADAGEQGEAPPGAPVRVAVLRVESLPPATVSVDGKPWGETPLELELLAGTYTVMVKNDAQGFSQSKTFTVAAGERKRWFATSPKAGKGTLEINAPPYATMFVDGRKVTTIPVATKTLELSAGVHKVELVLEDKSLPTPRKKKRSVTVKPAETSRLDVDMLVDD
jgi:hypothetical protein